MSKEVNMNEENFAMKLVEKQLRRSEYHFYAVCFLFFVFMLFAYLIPAGNEVMQLVDRSENVRRAVNDEGNSKS